MARTRHAIAALTSLLAPALVSAQSSPWPCEEPAWFPGEPISTIDGGPACSTVWDPDGAGPLPEIWVLGGVIHMAREIPVSGIATWDGQTWGTLGEGFGGGGSTATLKVWNGELYAGGSFTKSGSTDVNKVARWDAASDQWLPLGSGLSTTPLAVVFDLIPYNGQLVATGSFVQSGTAAVRRIAAWNGSTWTALGTGLQPSQSGFSSSIYGQTMAVYGNDLYVGGKYSNAGGVAANMIARWNGSVWSAVGTGPTGGTGGPKIFALQTYKNEMYAFGVFTAMGGVGTENIARWNGSEWLAMPVGVPFFGFANVGVLRVINDHLFVGGAFNKIGGVGSHFVAAWDGTDWLPMTGPSGTGSSWSGEPVLGLDSFQGEVHLAGGVGQIYNVPTRRIARWDGAAWHPVGDSGFDGAIDTLTEHEDRVIAGGSFTTTNGTSSLGAFDGTSWEPLQTSGSPWGSFVNSVASTPEGLVVSGNDGSSQLWGIGRWDGANWDPMGGGFQDGLSTGRAYSLLQTADGLIAGGNFKKAGGLDAPLIARWDGAQWHPYGTGLSGDSQAAVRAVAQWNGQIIAGGRFNTAGGTPANNIARWDGTQWHAMGAGLVGITYPVRAVIDWQGTLLATGENSMLSASATEDVIARWNPATEQWEEFAALSAGAGSGSGYALRTLGETLVVGGAFSNVQGVPAVNLALFDGTAWSPINGGTNGWVYALGTWKGQLTVGGTFSGVGDPRQPSGSFARYGCQPPACPADCDASGGLNIDDFICFQTLFALGDPAADCDGSGQLNIDDFICFQTFFALGC